MTSLSSVGSAQSFKSAVEISTVTTPTLVFDNVDDDAHDNLAIGPPIPSISGKKKRRSSSEIYGSVQTRVSPRKNKGSYRRDPSFVYY